MSDTNESFSAQVQMKIAERRTAKAEKAEEQKAQIEARRAKVEAYVEKVKDPNIPDDKKDKEASFLFKKLASALQSAISNLPSNLPTMGPELATYKATVDSQGKIAAELPAVGKKTPAEETVDSGQLTKTITLLRQFHKQLGRPEYRVEINVSDEDLKKEEETLKAEAEKKHKWTAPVKKEGESEESYNERKNQHDEEVKENTGDAKRNVTRRRVVEKVAKDVSDMPAEYAEQKIASLCEEASNQEEVQQEISDLLPQEKEETSGAEKGKPGQRELYKKGLNTSDMPSRASIRILAFEVQRSEDRKEWREEQVLGSINDPEVTEELHRIRDERRSGNSGERRVPWQKRGDQEKRRLVIERNNTLQNQIREELGEKSLEAYQALSGSEKRMIVENILRREIDLDNSINAVDGSLSTGNAAEICSRLSEAKGRKQDLKDFLSGMQVRIAGQKADNAWTSLREHAAKEFAGGGTIKIVEVVKLAGFVKEALVSRVGEHVEPIKQGVIKAIDEASSLGEGAADKVVEGYTRVAGMVHENIGRRLDEASQKRERSSHEARARSAEREASKQRTQIDMSTGLNRRINIISREFDKSKRMLAGEWAVAKRRISLDIRKGVREIISGPLTKEEQEALERKKQRLTVLQNKLVNERAGREALREHRGNEAYDYFWNDAMQYVDSVVHNDGGAVTEEVTVTPVSEPKKEAEEESPSAKKEAKTTKDKWQPDGDGDKKVWENIDDYEEQVNAGLFEARDFGEALFEANESLDVRVGDPKNLESNDLYQNFLQHRDQLKVLRDGIRSTLRSKDTDANIRKREQEERKKIQEYRRLLQEKWRIYDQLKKQKLV